MEHKFRALILCQKTQDEIRNNLTERIKGRGIRPIYHDETSLDMDLIRVTSEIKTASFIVTPAGDPAGYIHPSFEYEIAFGVRRPTLFIYSVNEHERLPDVFARQVFDITFDRVQKLVPFLNPGLRLFLNDLVADNIHTQMLYGEAREELGLEVDDERVRCM